MIGSIMLCATMAAALLLRRKAEPAASRTLAAFIALACVAAVPNLIGFAGAYDVWPGLTFLPTETFLLLGPLIVLHARALMVQSAQRGYTWLLAPGVVYWFYQLWAFSMLGGYEAKWAYNRAIHLPYVFPAVTGLTWVMIAGCVAYVWFLHRRYTAWLADNHSAKDRFDPTWLRHFILMAIAASGYWIAKSAISIWLQFDYFQNFVWDVMALFFVFVIALEAQVGIHQKFPKMMEIKPETQAANAPPPARDWKREGARLQAAVLEQRWYLDPNLSLQILSRRYGMNHVYLSRSINEGLECNFNGFINKLRVDYARELIENGDTRSLTNIALASGFGSKASFNRAFKLHVGISPSQYRARTVST
ncbi:MAG: helix-turn-helix domain-containing protein [Pseudomonadota bacterium]